MHGRGHELTHRATAHDAKPIQTNRCHVAVSWGTLAHDVPPFLGLLRCPPNPVPTVPVVPKNCCQAFNFQLLKFCKWSQNS